MNFKTTKHDKEHPKEEVNMIFSHGALMCNNDRFLHMWGGRVGWGAPAPGAKLKTSFFAVTYDMPTHRDGQIIWSLDV